MSEVETTEIFSKAELRQKFLSLRSGLSESARKTADKKIFERLLALPYYQRTQVVYCYVSVKNEADTRKIIRESLEKRMKVAVPRVTGRGRMEFCFIQSPADLVAGKWSIPEPGDWCVKAPCPDRDSLVLMPGVVFDRKGNRIGYGGGFYDRYLAQCTDCMKIALAFSCQCIENVTCDTYDVHADIIITEKEMIVCQEDFR